MFRIDVRHKADVDRRSAGFIEIRQCVANHERAEIRAPEPLGQGVRPSVASPGDLARMLGARGREIDLENLRMLCPNCAATLDTHCGRNTPRSRVCPGCGGSFEPRNVQHRYCSMRCCGRVAAKSYRGSPHPNARKVPRPFAVRHSSRVFLLTLFQAGQ